MMATPHPKIPGKSLYSYVAWLEEHGYSHKTTPIYRELRKQDPTPIDRKAVSEALLYLDKDYFRDQEPEFRGWFRTATDEEFRNHYLGE